MSLFPFRITRTSKPPMGTPIDWSNPLTQGLVGAWAFNEGGGTSAYNLVSGKTNLLNGAVVYKNSEVSFPGAATDNIILDTTAKVVNFTFITECTRSTDTLTYGPQMVQEAFTIGTGMFEFNMGNGYGAAEDIDKPRIAVISGGGSVTGFLNGKQMATCNPFPLAAVNGNYDTYAGVVTGATPSDQVFRIGTANATYALKGSIKWFLLYNRALSPSEIASLSANPWQIYEPEIKWITLEEAIAAGLIFTRQGSNFVRGQMNGSFRGL